MKTKLFTKSEKQLPPYFAVYREMLTATGWKGWEQVKVKNSQDKFEPTGEIVEVVYPFSCEDKILWCWMLDRFQFFKESKNIWFDNQDEVAAYTGISVSTVKRFIKKLSVSGVLKIDKKNMGGARFSNSYVITKDLELVQPANTAQKASISPQVERSEETNTNTQTAEYVELELADEAWAQEAIPDYDYEYYEPSVDEQDMDSNYYNPDDLKEKTEDDVDEPSFMKVKASVQKAVKTTSSGFTPLPSELFNRKGDDLSDKMYDWVDRNGIYYRGANNFVANLFHNATDTNYVIKNGELVNMGVEKEEEELLPF